MPNEGTTNKRLLVRVFVAIAGSFSAVSPSKRPFSLADPSISLPYKKDTISIALAAIVCGVIPAAIIAIVSCSIAAWRARRADVHLRGQVTRRELWEWLTGWLGLGLSFVTAFFFAQAVKNLVGKPRPDFLARCNPDSANESAYALEHYDPAGRVLVDWHICQTKNGGGVGISEFNDGFRSFPSGHTCSKFFLLQRLDSYGICANPSTFVLVAFAGLLYLSLWLAMKFSVGIPILYSDRMHISKDPPFEHGGIYDEASSLRRQNAAPPLYLVALILIPLAVAIYIATTRYQDGKHHGFDVVFSAIIGSVSGYLGFRLYHLPIGKSAGRSWGPRGRHRAFGIKIGVLSYAEPVENERRTEDIEIGHTSL
jgi:membrane-associated phospholipid phosphatase